MKLSTRPLAMAATAALIGLIVAVGVPATAQAATPVTPLSVLPSQLVNGTTAATTADASIIRMAQVYKFLTAPSTVAALKAQAAGTATSSQLAEISSVASSSRIPLAVGGLTKVAGAAGVAYTGYKIGSSMGAGAAGKITTSIWGVDANNLVCGAAPNGGTGQKFLSFFAGQNCSAFGAADGFTPNEDAVPGTSVKEVCNSNGSCAKYKSTGMVTWTAQGGQTIYSPSICFSLSGPPMTGGVGQIVAAYTSRLSADRDWSSPGGAGVSTVQSLRYQEGTTPPCGNATDGITEVSRGGVDDPYNAYILKTLKLDCVFVYDGSATQTCASPGAVKPETVTGDPLRTIRCDITTSAGSVVSAESHSFKESETDWSEAIPECPTLDAGLLPVKQALILHTIGGSDQTLWSHDISQQQQDDLGKYKDCLTTVCQLILEKNDVSCFDSTGLCTGWYADPNKADTYKCKYAGKPVALSECDVYRPSWEPDQVTQGVRYADPVTKAPAKASTDTKENTTVSPDVDSGTYNAPLDNPESTTKKCFSQTFSSFNPIEWVMRPVQCSLQWAFVPRPSVVKADLDHLNDEYSDSAPGKLAATLGTFNFQAPSGCNGVRVDVSFLGPAFYVMSACPGQMLAPIATFAKLVCGILTVLAGVASITRSIGGVAQFRGIGGGDGE